MKKLKIFAVLLAAASLTACSSMSGMKWWGDSEAEPAVGAPLAAPMGGAPQGVPMGAGRLYNGSFQAIYRATIASVQAQSWEIRTTDVVRGEITAVPLATIFEPREWITINMIRQPSATGVMVEVHTETGRERSDFPDFYEDLQRFLGEGM